MKKINKRRFLSLKTTLLALAILAVPTVCMASQQSLTANNNFAVLASSAITNTGNSIINGDVGMFPGTAFTGQSSLTLNGNQYLADAVANTAQTNLANAYNANDTTTNDTCIPTELGGTTLTPGNYDSASGTFGITGTVTLDAQGNSNAYFVLNAASTLITASGSNIKLINGANANHIIWTVGSSATLGTYSNFKGRILAVASITANTGVTVKGQLLAQNGAVTLDNNTITK